MVKIILGLVFLIFIAIRIFSFDVDEDNISKVIFNLKIIVVCTLIIIFAGYVTANV